VDRVDLNGRDNIEAGLLEAEGHAASTRKKIDTDRAHGRGASKERNVNCRSTIDRLIEKVNDSTLHRQRLFELALPDHENFPTDRP
jgi:hypothetical protein